MPEHSPILLETRTELLPFVPKNGRIAELGVFKGDFAAELIAYCSPRELLLVDFWAGEIGSTDHNGHGAEFFQGEDLFARVRQRFADAPQVKLLRMSTVQALQQMEPDSLDMVYIDADHSYLGCIRDLEESWRAIKSGGWIMGHDYGCNTAKAPNHFKYGVEEAVNEFCRKFGQTIHALAMDGYVSFAIKLNK